MNLLVDGQLQAKSILRLGVLLGGPGHQPASGIREVGDIARAPLKQLIIDALDPGNPLIVDSSKAQNMCGKIPEG